MVKIALLFLTINDVYHADYWQDFLAGHENQYSIYVHAKNGVPSDSFFKPFELSTTVPTTWANSMRGEIRLLQEALKDRNNKKFIMLSETTIPLSDFDDVYNTVLATSKSIFVYHVNPHQYPNNACYKKRNLLLIPEPFRYKNSQWVILNRKHAQLMAADKEYIDIIATYEADNELYPATFLASQGRLNEIEPVDKTYVNWSKPGPHPFLFSHLDKAGERVCIIKAIQQGYLFARKFAEHADLSFLDPYLPYRLRAVGHTDRRLSATYHLSIFE